MLSSGKESAIKTRHVWWKRKGLMAKAINHDL